MIQKLNKKIESKYTIKVKSDKIFNSPRVALQKSLQHDENRLQIFPTVAADPTKTSVAYPGKLLSPQPMWSNL